MLRDSIYPQAFFAARRTSGAEAYLDNPSTSKLVEFFQAKGVPALKEEDQREQWYDDWLIYQKEHRLYASVLAPEQHPDRGFGFDLLAYCRFLEVFAYCSPAHGYSLQVTSLGLFAILLGASDKLRQEAIETVQQGGLLAFGVSEKQHGSDLLGNEFAVTEIAPDRLIANGIKYYIGNCSCAAIITVLARKDDPAAGRRTRRSVPILFALRPNQCSGFRIVRKIRTLGVRSAFVGEFGLETHELPRGDVIAEGRGAWEAIFGAITLGKFLLGFGSIGICEHAFEEAAAHLNQRILYGKRAIEMPHLRRAMAQAYVRLTAMKLYAYRTLDYLHGSSDADRRYLLYCAVQKAKVSTEGVKVISLLSECIGAKGFEADAYFEMALRDIQLIPGLEGSTHVNLGLTAQFIPRYFADVEEVAQPESLASREPEVENLWMMRINTAAPGSVVFAKVLAAYAPLMSIPSVRLFAAQVSAFQLFVQTRLSSVKSSVDLQAQLLLGQCLATIAYGQLIAENSIYFSIPPEIVSAIFGLLVNDLATAAVALASSGQFELATLEDFLPRMRVIPPVTNEDWDFVSSLAATR